MYVVELPLDDDGDDTIAVQIREQDEGLIRVGRTGTRLATQASRSLGAMLDTVRPVAERFVESFRSMPDAPDEMTLEFGISLSAEADVVVARSAGEANFSVTLVWNDRTNPGDTNPGEGT